MEIIAAYTMTLYNTIQSKYLFSKRFLKAAIAVNDITVPTLFYFQFRKRYFALRGPARRHGSSARRRPGS